jgi:hypothetical protein
MNRNENKEGFAGLGNFIAPLKMYVLVYFSQQGQPESAAMQFYEYYDSRQWKNTKGSKIKNWKVHAWQWIWYGSHNQ